MSPTVSEKIIDLIIPVYNEAGVVEHTYGKLSEVIRQLPYTFHIYFVDDGSTDATAASLTALAQPNGCITVLTLARNFGHQAALTAGLDASRGDFVITMDADGQHPPEMIPQMI
jgi:glycosyltransferase involved in cell wall biosynthesis